MAVVKFEDNGQGYYDFDALLKVTSKDFVDRVVKCVEIYEDNGVNFDLKVISDDVIPTVYIYQNHAVRVLKFYGEGSMFEILLTKSDVDEMAGFFND